MAKRGSMKRELKAGFYEQGKEEGCREIDNFDRERRDMKWAMVDLG